MSDFTGHEDFSEPQPPTFEDLEQHAEAGLAKRAISRYLFTHNPDRSIKMWTVLGAPLVRLAIMRTYGRLYPRKIPNNYRLDATKPRIEAATRFAVGGSVFNEAVHTVVALPNIYAIAGSLAEGHTPDGSNIFWAGFNLALVGLQRYNRARMIKRVNEELAAGQQFDPDYENWLGVDARAVDNYHEALDTQPHEEPQPFPGTAVDFRAA